MSEQRPSDDNTREARSLRRLAAATGIFALAILISRLLGMVRQMIVAARFGANVDMDAYSVAYNLPFRLATASQTIAAGAMVPVLARHLQTGEPGEARRVSGTILTVVAVVCAVLSGIGILLSRPVAQVLAPGFAPEALTLTASLTRLLAPYLLFAGVGGTLACVVLAHQKYVAPAVAQVAPNIVIIAVLLGLPVAMGIQTLALGVTLGGLAYLGVLALTALRLPGSGGPRYWCPRHPSVAKIGRLAVPLLIPALGAPLVAAFERNLLSGHAAGTIASLSYAEEVFAIPIGLLISSLGTVLLPMLSWDAGSEDKTQLARRSSIAFRLVIMATVLIVALLMGLGRLAVVALYGSGMFDNAAVGATAGVLLWQGPSAVGAGLTEVLTKAYHATQDTVTPAIVWLVTVVLRSALAVLVTPRMAARGIALTRTVGITAQSIYLAFAVAGKVGRPIWRDAVRMGVTCGIVGALVCVALVTVEGFLPLVFTRGRAMAGAWCGGLALVGTLVYVALVLAVNPRERNSIIARVRQRVSGR